MTDRGSRPNKSKLTGENPKKHNQWHNGSSSRNGKRPDSLPTNRQHPSFGALCGGFLGHSTKMFVCFAECDVKCVAWLIHFVFDAHILYLVPFNYITHEIFSYKQLFLHILFGLVVIVRCARCHLESNRCTENVPSPNNWWDDIFQGYSCIHDAWLKILFIFHVERKKTNARMRYTEPEWVNRRMWNIVSRTAVRFVKNCRKFISTECGEWFAKGMWNWHRPLRAHTHTHFL